MHSLRWTLFTLAFTAASAFQLKAAADEICLCAAEATTNYGHRGFGNSLSDNAYAENTLPAIEHALNFTDAIEIDIHLTDDGHLLVTHDATLERLTDQTGCALSRPIDELLEIDAGGPHLLGQGLRFPTLDALLETLDLGLLNIELKLVPEGAAACEPTDRDALLDLLIPMLEDYDGRAEFIITSFDLEVLVRLRERAPDFRIGFLSNLPEDIVTAAEAGFEAVNLSAYFLGDLATAVSDAHSRGLELNVWTVDDPELMRELIDAGVDGIITNRPDTLETLTAEYCAEDDAPVRCFEEESSSGGCSATGEAPENFAILAFALILAMIPRHYIALRRHDR